jgi:hypothetical protein
MQGHNNVAQNILRPVEDTSQNASLTRMCLCAYFGVTGTLPRGMTKCLPSSGRPEKVQVFSDVSLQHHCRHALYILDRMALSSRLVSEFHFLPGPLRSYRQPIQNCPDLSDGDSGPLPGRLYVLAPLNILPRCSLVLCFSSLERRRLDCW